MQEDNRYTVPEAHRHFAVQFNEETWKLLEQPERSPAEDERMVYASHASCRHWLEAGTSVNHQRSEWLIARVYTVLENATMAVNHATRCLELTLGNPDQMEDFDWAFAYEGVARLTRWRGTR